ncbi:MAG: YitT family protein [Erysipelotrichaceae bacterium]|nr:YitT family protein [Erysipelotrichaceae bacterium]
MKRTKFIETLIILFGNFLLAVSVEYFVLPFDILSGGCAGLAVILANFINVPANYIVDFFVLLFFLMGAVVLGREFTIKTALCSLTYPFMLEFLSKFPVKLEINEFLAVIYGGVIAGIGLGLVFRCNASTGGTDVPIMIAHKYTNIPIGTLNILIDSTIAIAGLCVYGMEEVMMGVIYIYLSGKAINAIMIPRSDNAVALYIITDKKDQINKYIHEDLERGTTIMLAKGGYTGNPKEVIMTVVQKGQYVKLSKYIEETDPYAFVIVSDAKEIKGEGFTYEYRV